MADRAGLRRPGCGKYRQGGHVDPDSDDRREIRQCRDDVLLLRARNQQSVLEDEIEQLYLQRD